MSVELTDGRWPEQENEITAPASYLKKLGKEAVIGEIITLDLGEHVPQEYIVCGITKDAANNSGNSYEVLVSQAFLDACYADAKPYYPADLRMTDSDRFENAELKQHIIKHFAAYGIEETNIAFSSSCFGTLDNTSRDISVVLGVSLLITVACATVIYSLFYISVTGKIREYGRLRVIGMTQKQGRRMVRKESWKLSLLSIGKYTAAVGDVIEIETDTGKKVEFTVMGMIDRNLKEYAGFYVYVPQELLSVIRPNPSPILIHNIYSA